MPELAHRITGEHASLLERLFRVERLYIACEEGFFVWFRRFLMTGARFDTVDWARKVCMYMFLLLNPLTLNKIDRVFHKRIYDLSRSL
jgi:hypothetical protein